MARSSAIVVAKASNGSAAGPSWAAEAGSGWRARSTPSAPAATAARAIGRTCPRSPVPWLGSTTIGRWLFFLTTDTAAIVEVDGTRACAWPLELEACAPPDGSPEETYELAWTDGWLVRLAARYSREAFEVAGDVADISRDAFGNVLSVSSRRTWWGDERVDVWSDVYRYGCWP